MDKLSQIIDKGNVHPDILDVIYLSHANKSQEYHALINEVREHNKRIENTHNQILDSMSNHNLADDKRFAEILTILKERGNQRLEEHKMLHDSLIEAVDKKMNEKFNGKVGKIMEMFSRIEPIVKTFEDNETFKREGKKYIKTAGIIAGGIGSFYIIREFIIKFLLK